MELLNRNSSFSTNKKGFTLIEILVSTTILVIAMASIWVSFKGGTTSWAKGTSRMEVYLNARAALDMMSREIGAAMLAASGTYTIDFIDSADTSGALRFAAARDNSGKWDLCEIAYKYNGTDKEVERALDINPNFSADEKAGAGLPKLSDLSPDYDSLVSNVSSLTFEFWDASIPGWRSDWDSRESGTVAGQEGGGIDATRNLLPEKVKITITIQDEQNREEQTFSTIVYLPMSK